MLRSDGVDIPNYRYSFEEGYEFGISDPGFRYLIDIFNFFHLPLETLFFFVGCIAIIALRRVSFFFKVDQVLLFLLFFFHLFVVRDFAQLRVGLAIYFAFLGLTSKKFVKTLLYLLAISTHLTSIIFIFGYEGSSWVSKFRSLRKRLFLLIIGVISIIIVGKMISYLSFLDWRIETYLKWDKEGYGAKVNSMGIVYLHIFLIAITLFFRRSSINCFFIRALLYIEVLTIVAFISFSDYAIFAFRLSNVLSSLYPVLILLIPLLLYLIHFLFLVTLHLHL